MNDDTKNSAEDEQQEKLIAELKRFRALFEDAFDELHNAVVAKVNTLGTYLGSHYDYPIQRTMENGFPSFSDAGSFRPNSPRDYVGTVRPSGLLGFYTGSSEGNELELPKSKELKSFLSDSPFGKRLFFDERLSDISVDILIGDAVERYLHLHGLEAPVSPKLRRRIIAPLILSTVKDVFSLRLVVPITMTSFEFDHFRLSSSSYITRIPKKIQLARSRVSSVGSGVEKSVADAATHAFVSTGWELEGDTSLEVGRSLRHFSENVKSQVDSFFGAFRIATGIDTGYAQVLWLPKGWAWSYFCDLPPLYGTSVRQYPSTFDNYGWTAARPVVSTKNMAEVKQTYLHILNNEQSSVDLAIKRMNSCLTRDDPADAVLDGAIGLELLLSDQDKEALSYKLRLRAAALTHLGEETQPTAAQVVDDVKRLYATRSAIVHGKKPKASKSADKPDTGIYSDEKKLASDLLRFVLRKLLDNPEYLDPTKIDRDLLLGPPEQKQLT